MLWSRVLDDSRYDIIKSYLLLGIGVIYSSEVCLFIIGVELIAFRQVLAHCEGYTRSFVLPVVTFINVYGYCDAVLRFPSIPRLDSFFAAKLLICLIAKTVVYATGFIHIQDWALSFLSGLFVNVWLLPVLYVMALALGDSSPFRKDRDMLISVLALLADRQERIDILTSVRRHYAALRKHWHLERFALRSELIINDKAYI